jgi:lysophospholipase L1-like esterase
MPLASPFAFALGQVPGGLSTEQALDLLVQLLPDKFAKWTGILARRGDPYNFYAVVADAFKTFIYDGMAQLRLENNPATAGWRLPDYEAALGLSTTPTALTGTPQRRRLQIISKLREQGATTIANIQSIVAPLLGYIDPSQLKVYECNRAALTAAHTYTNGSNAIFTSTPVTQSVFVSDDGGVSDAGAQLLVTLTATNPELLTLTLTGPSGGAGSGVATKTWPAGSLPPGNASSVLCRLNFPEAAGKKIRGEWRLTMSSSSPTQVINWSVFVEGGGLRDQNGGSGLGEEMHEWGVFVDPALATAPDLPAVRAALQRIQPADSIADVLFSVVGSFPDVSSGANSAIPDCCLPVAVDPPSPFFAWRSALAVPMTSGAGAGNRVYHAPLIIPSDVTSIQLGGANRMFNAGAGGGAVSIDAAAYVSDGTGAATGLATGVLTGVSLPSDGTFNGALGALPVTRGSDGRSVLVHSYPNSAYANSIGNDNGAYSNGTLTVSPLPAVTGPNANPVFWFDYSYSTARRRVAVVADSIGGGYSPDSSVGFQNAAWNQLMRSQDWAVLVQSVVQYGSLDNYANFAGLPALWDRLDTILANAYALVVQLGTNDLAYLNLATMQTGLQAIIAHAVAKGVPRVLAWTIPPQTGYSDPSDIRGQFNTWLRANWVSLGLFAIYDAASSQATGGIADNTTQTSIYSGYATVDNTHPSIAGQTQIAAGWLAKLP